MKNIVMMALLGLLVSGGTMVSAQAALAQGGSPAHLANIGCNAGVTTEFCFLCQEIVGAVCDNVELSTPQRNILLGQCSAAVNSCLAEYFTPGTDPFIGCVVNFYKGVIVFSGFCAL